MFKPKKHLGQHFLKDENAAKKVAEMFSKRPDKPSHVLEIGPGTGILTKYLLKEYENLKACELDTDSVDYLLSHKILTINQLVQGDILNLDLKSQFESPLAVIGNFPYNISSQIVFSILEYRGTVTHFGGMFQKEVAERLCAGPGTKVYGILSVLLNAFYDTKYLFSLDPAVFNPPPKVFSGVISCVRRDDYHLKCNEKLFFNVVKTAFNQRRKMLRNALHKFNLPDTNDFLKLRAEQLSVDDFVRLTCDIENCEGADF